ncbi:MAG: hypothetical protein U9P49_05840 [Thermodesulfobacteriota bacterium]|nr:hypothetical protein [Thermodesulfobacteriota bacterium]
MKDELLHYYYDSREVFVVDFDPKKVRIEQTDGMVRFIKKIKMNEEIEDIIKIAEALEAFKVKVYARMNRGDKEFDDFVMKNAPCNYDIQGIIQKLKKEEK